MPRYLPPHGLMNEGPTWNTPHINGRKHTTPPKPPPSLIYSLNILAKALIILLPSQRIPTCLTTTSSTPPFSPTFPY